MKKNILLVEYNDEDIASYSLGALVAIFVPPVIYNQFFYLIKKIQTYWNINNITVA